MAVVQVSFDCSLRASFYKTSTHLIHRPAVCLFRNETGKAISHQAVGSMGSEKGKRQEDELTDGLASIRSLFADHR
ncbi:hypothetical protein T4D_11984 [Trichinella pseudospiralis]|uniref:Uncharacterized protein n=1 Tax=Trichinella pseudospiralis TaxID=6337 RepID=A0A0V1G4G8_TRIPS|nr:hypothetical protein T4D_11984 [Trichinella pseudospiralis]